MLLIQVEIPKQLISIKTWRKVYKIINKHFDPWPTVNLMQLGFQYTQEFLDYLIK